ncbi:MAG TPA: hypothetical protein VGW33_09395 [Terriglobia bacterium]|nr:hypothetical protein [Terriglobia bacterium]
MARILGRFTRRGARNVRGIWRVSYDYRTGGKKGETRVEKHLIELHQFGSRVWGRNITGAKHWYRIFGRLEREIHLTGFWENILADNIYHGTFQFLVDWEGNKMQGAWLGFNKRNEIQHGSWHWERISRATDSSSKKRATNSEAVETPAVPIQRSSKPKGS